MSSEQITREILGNIPTHWVIVFYIVTALACGLAAWGFVARHLRRRSGQSQNQVAPARSLGARVGTVLLYLTFHRQLLRDWYAGLAHLLMFYGFFILFIGTCLVALEHDTPLHFFYGNFYLWASLIIDLGGVALVVGLIMFLVRRLRPTPGRELRVSWMLIMPVLLLLIGISGFVVEAARIAQTMPSFERWSVVGYALAWVMRLVPGLDFHAIHQASWVIHAALCVLFFALLPWRFFGHMVHGAMSWAQRKQQSIAHLRLPRPEVAPGATKVNDLLMRDLLHADACTTCGRCNSVCPATAAGKPLQPRDVVLSLRQSLDQGSQTTLSLDPDVLWSCTTCGACNHACPVGIEVYDKIIELRRGEVEAGRVPERAAEVFESTAERFNPFGKPAASRTAWMAGLTVPVAKADEAIELLYWVGCSGSFDPDGQSVAANMVKILNHLGVKYRVLANKERCTGDPARRMGEEGLFRELARQNAETLRKHKVTHILTHCPHCWNTFQNEYPQVIDGSWSMTVEHHSEFLARMIQSGRLKLSHSTSNSLTFHDPCYLGRGNGQTQAPRDVLMSLPQANLHEMPRHGRDSFCCGAGGGSMWLDVRGKDRIENLRANEAVETGARTLATACPFCKGMFNSTQASHALRVRDLAELVVEAEGLS